MSWRSYSREPSSRCHSMYEGNLKPNAHNARTLHCRRPHGWYSYYISSIHGASLLNERWAGHVARLGEGRGVHRVLVGKPEGKNHWGDPDVDGRIILRRIFRKWEGVVGTGWSWLRIGTGGGHLWVRWWTSGFHKMRGISWIGAEPVSFSRRILLHGVSE